MEKWRESWRVIVKELPTKGLEALRASILGGGKGLLSGYTCMEGSNGEILGACAIGLALWKGNDLKFSEEIKIGFDFLRTETYFRDNFRGFGDFVGWFDSFTFKTEERKVRNSQLLYEVELELALRDSAKEPQLCPAPVVDQELMFVG